MTNIEYQINILNAVKNGKEIQWCEVPNRHYKEDLDKMVKKGVISVFKYHRSECTCRGQGGCDGCGCIGEDVYEDFLIEWMDWEFANKQDRDYWRPDLARHLYRVKPEPMKRFMVFAGEAYYPQRPIGDFVCSVDSLNDVGDLEWDDGYDTLTLAQLLEEDNSNWVQILDRESGEMFEWGKP